MCQERIIYTMATQEDSEALAQNQIGENLAPFNPSMQPVVEVGLSLLNMSKDDILYELGCGDGRFMVAAALATPGLKCIGVEYDSKFADRAKAAVVESGLQNQVTVHHANVLDIDFTEATAVFVYLVPKGLNLVAERLQQGLSVVYTCGALFIFIHFIGFLSYSTPFFFLFFYKKNT